MSSHFDYEARAREAFDEYASGEATLKDTLDAIRDIAQQKALVQASLYPKDRSDRWKRDAQFEYELDYETELWSPLLKTLFELSPEDAQTVEAHLKNLRAMSAQQKRSRGFSS
jgi:hypothetical protein